MNDNQLRKEIYHRLGLPFDSLSSESGNDWERTKAEVLEEHKQKNFTKNTVSSIKILDNEYEEVLSSTAHNIQDKKIFLASSPDLQEDEIIKLIETGNKEVLIAISLRSNLNKIIIEKLIEKGTYKVKINLINHHTLTRYHKQLLLSSMENFKDLYHDYILKISQ